MRPELSILLVTGVFAGIMRVGLKLRTLGWHPEATRKLVHIGMGGVTIAFPWLFAEATSVVLLCTTFVGVLIALRTVPVLQTAKRVMGDVERSSLGEIYFAISAAVLFVLTGRAPLFYAVPLLVLTFADATSALVGIRFGRHPYHGADGQKSWEGSVAFAAVAFVCTWIPLMLWHPEPASKSFLVAACVALLTMLIESSAWRGIDNLLLPLATIAMLRIYDTQTPDALVQRLGILLALAFVFLCCRRRALLREGVLLGAVLVTYLGWALGGWPWLAAPLAVLIVPPLLAQCDQPREAHHALLSIGIPPAIWLLGSSIVGKADWLSSYTVAYASQLAMTGVALQRDRVRTFRRRLRACVSAATISWVLLLLPFVWIECWSAQAIATMMSSLPLLIATAFIFARFQDLYSKQVRPEMYWFGRSLVAFAGSLAVSISQVNPQKSF
ncbi:diacylglycerol/polyprenol kinase family protein [Verrucomicrobiota bacterium sgz303538]